MTVDLSEDDGEAVVAGTERIGTVTDVRGGTAYVDPDVEQGRESLGRSTDDERDTLDEGDVTAVGNSQVRLRDGRYLDARPAPV